MTVPLQKTGYRESPYERPTRKWVCGRAAEGDPCAMGPDRRGRCTAPMQSSCDPRREGDRYFCERAAAYGGPCAAGPLPDGSCSRPEPTHPECQPRLSLRAKRGRLAFSICALSIGVAILLVAGPGSPTLLSPGELKPAHRAIVATAGPGEGCNACHATAERGPAAWLGAAFGSGAGPVQNGACLRCHFRTEPEGGETASFAHGVDPGRLAEAMARAGELESSDAGLLHALAALGGGPIESAGESIPCAACHREHRGAGDNLVLDDIRCQSCHRIRFRSFAAGHPALGPVRRARAGIRFDHYQHQQTHFGEDPFACSRCHAPGDGGRIGLKPYEESCTGCHHQGKADWHTGKITQASGTVFQLPEFEFYEEGVNYPLEAARGEEITPMMRLLLLGGGDDLLPALTGVAEEAWAPVWWDPDEEEPKERLAAALVELSEAAATDPDSITGRIAGALGPGIEPEADRLAQVLRAAGSALAAWRRSWSDVAVDWSPPPGLERWDLDRTAAAVVYRPTGHSDSLLRTWIDALAAGTGSAGGSERTELRDRIVGEALGSGGGILFSACLRCHTADLGERRRVVNWREAGREILTRGWERFDHRSHSLLLPGEEGCRHCHPIAAAADGEMGRSRGIEAHRAERCTVCHSPGGAPDDCLTCHRYHFRRP